MDECVTNGPIQVCELKGGLIAQYRIEPAHFGLSQRDAAGLWADSPAASLALVRQARAAVSLPVLRKEFIVDAYQFMESRALGADCILLITSALAAAELASLHRQALDLGLDVLIEVHDATEVRTALSLAPELIGINNRNLKTFATRIETTLDLLDQIPNEVLVVTESGFHHRHQVRRMRTQGVHAFLVGEAFMQADDPGAALTELFGHLADGAATGR